MTNEGTVDRTLRVILGIGLLAIAFVGPQSPLGWIVGVNTCALPKK